MNLSTQLPRRKAIKIVAASLLTPSAMKAAGQSQPKQPSKAHPRIACTTATFRDRFSEEDSVNDAAAFFVDELGINQVELLAKHISDPSPQALDQLRASAEKHGARFINIQLDGPKYNLSAPNPEQRAASITLVKQWMNRAARLGCDSLRANTGRGKAFVLADTSDSFKQLAEHGKAINVKILIENHGGHSAKAQNILSILGAVNHPYLQSLPDFGNVPTTANQAQREAFIKQMIPSAHLISAKFMNFDANQAHTPYDIGSLVSMCEAAGYRGLYSLEQYAPDPLTMDRVKACRQVMQIIETNLSQGI